jgi:hypothetical protein
MNGLRVAASGPLLALLALIGSTHPAAQQQFTQEELTVHPYLLTHGQRSQKERMARHAALAAIAEQAGDLPRAARQLWAHCSLLSNQTGARRPAQSDRRQGAATGIERRHSDVDLQLRRRRGHAQ